MLEWIDAFLLSPYAMALRPWLILAGVLGLIGLCIWWMAWGQDLLEQPWGVRAPRETSPPTGRPAVESDDPVLCLWCLRNVAAGPHADDCGRNEPRSMGWPHTSPPGIRRP